MLATRLLGVHSEEPSSVTTASANVTALATSATIGSPRLLSPAVVIIYLLSVSARVVAVAHVCEGMLAVSMIQSH